MDLGEDMNPLTSSFSKKELYNFLLQLIRSIESVALNISEGAIGQTNPEQNRFIGYAIRSLAETLTCLHKAKRRDYISLEDFQKKYDELFHPTKSFLGSWLRTKPSILKIDNALFAHGGIVDLGTGIINDFNKQAYIYMKDSMFLKIMYNDSTEVSYEPEKWE